MVAGETSKRAQSSVTVARLRWVTNSSTARFRSSTKICSRFMASRSCAVPHRRGPTDIVADPGLCEQERGQVGAGGDA